MTKYYMDPISGNVQTLRMWKIDFMSMSAESWGGEEFEDAQLIAVARDINGEWAEIE